MGAYLGVDYPNPDYSHFQSVYYWRTGQLQNGATTGWLGNWLDALRLGHEPAPGRRRAVGAPTTCCATRRAPTAAVYSPSDFSLLVGRRSGTRTALVTAYGRTAGPARLEGPPARDGRRRASRSTSTTR